MTTTDVRPHSLHRHRKKLRYTFIESVNFANSQMTRILSIIGFSIYLSSTRSIHNSFRNFAMLFLIYFHFNDSELAIFPAHLFDSQRIIIEISSMRLKQSLDLEHIHIQMMCRVWYLLRTSTCCSRIIQYRRGVTIAKSHHQTTHL